MHTCFQKAVTLTRWLLFWLGVLFIFVLTTKYIRSVKNYSLLQYRVFNLLHQSIYIYIYIYINSNICLSENMIIYNDR